MPGHGDWEQGEPKIMVTDGPCKNTMNPTEPATYTFLASRAHILYNQNDLSRTPYCYVLYGAKYIGLASLFTPVGHKLYKIKMAQL